ncbi:Uncharacterised protein [Mycobacteroides abscessus subsp. abscessus]|nr:Uncharacterised protein [Mycobacteroides abscessus subsp. abscessus]
MRNIALGRGSITRPSTSMAPSFFAMSSAILGGVAIRSQGNKCPVERFTPLPG